MTLAQFAAKYCSNHQPDGSCLGASITLEGTSPPLRPKPRCVVTEERCQHFEECLLPYAGTAWRIPDKRAAASIVQAANSYRLRHGLDDAPKRVCPDCRRPLAKGKQRCAKCAEAWAKRAKRARQQRWREAAAAKSAEARLV